jgi:hypothetical protein
MVVTSVVDEDDTHDAIQIVGVLTIDGDASLVLERLTDPTLEKILVELRKEQGVEWSLTLLEGVKVKVVTHLIYPRKKNLVHIKC